MPHHPHHAPSDRATNVQQNPALSCDDVQHFDDRSDCREAEPDRERSAAEAPEVGGVCPVTRRKPLWQDAADRAGKQAEDVAPLHDNLRHFDFLPTARPKQLSEQQKTAIELLLAGMTDAQIAEELDVHRSTLWRWRTRDETFRRVLAAARQRAFRDAAGRLRELVPKAMEVLHSQLDADNYQAAIRVLRLAKIDENRSGIDPDDLLSLGMSSPDSP